MEVQKEVKKEVKEKVQLKFLLDQLKAQKTPSQISKEFNIPKQNLSYYLRQLKDKGLVQKVGYGTWEVKTFNLNTLTKKDKLIRGHALIWKIKLHKEFQWKQRLEQANLTYNLVRGLIPRTFINNKKVWFGKKTITIYEPNSFYGENAIESRKYAVISLLETLQAIESKLSINLRPYTFQACREHYALIKNDLARQCNREGERIEVSDNNGKWLWIDMSDGIGELETGNQNALVNNIGVQKWWNNMKETNFEVTPKFVLNTMNGIQQNQLIFAENMKSHIQAIQTLSRETKRLGKTMKGILSENMQLRLDNKHQTKIDKFIK